MAAVAEYPGAQENRFVAERGFQQWKAWPVNWSAVWVGTMASIAMVLLFGLIGIAVGAHLLGPEHRVVDLHKIGMVTLVLSVCAAFFSFVIGGWIAGKIAGTLRSEPAILHGAIVWLIAVPLLTILAAAGAGTALGAWHSGLTARSDPSMPFDQPAALGVGATAEDQRDYNAAQMEYRRAKQQWDEDTPKVVRNNALGAVSALLLGLIGSVIGGWMASGEPMTFGHYRRRAAVAAVR